MNKTVVIDIVGLSSSVIGEYTPFIKQYISSRNLSTIQPVLPAVTTTSQSTYSRSDVQDSDQVGARHEAQESSRTVTRTGSTESE